MGEIRGVRAEEYSLMFQRYVVTPLPFEPTPLVCSECGDTLEPPELCICTTCRQEQRDEFETTERLMTEFLKSCNWPS